MDLIERQAAIDVLWKALYKYEDKMEKQFQDSDELDTDDWFVHRIFVQNMSDIDRQTILELPSAQPETCVDAVSRKDAIKDVCDALKVAFAIDEDLEEALDIITTTISTSPSVSPDTKFFDFLWNVINPNDMENYLSMYHSREGKQMDDTISRAEESGRRK